MNYLFICVTRPEFLSMRVKDPKQHKFRPLQIVCTFVTIRSKIIYKDVLAIDKKRIALVAQQN